MDRLNNPPEWEFFNIKQDSVEFINLSNNPSFSGEMNRLKQALEDWQKQTENSFNRAEIRDLVEAKFRR
jgi:N-sulfoglucosamine sulfohydrolase